MAKNDKLREKAIIHTHHYDYMVKNGMDEAIAFEIDEYEKQKGKRRKRLEIKNKKEERWK